MSYFIKYDIHLQKKWTLRKSGPYVKIHCIRQKHQNDKLEVLTSNVTIMFLYNSNLKTPKSDIFGPKVKDF